jgi:hypothetical protein
LTTCASTALSPRFFRNLPSTLAFNKFDKNHFQNGISGLLESIEIAAFAALSADHQEHRYEEAQRPGLSSCAIVSLGISGRIGRYDSSGQVSAELAGACPINL